jgi:hypothetical protein
MAGYTSASAQPSTRRVWSASGLLTLFEVEGARSAKKREQAPALPNASRKSAAKPDLTQVEHSGQLLGTLKLLASSLM